MRAELERAFQDALAVATRWHAGQVDKAGEPYIRHCRRVALHLMRRWPDATPEEVQAAILHDVIEDTPAARVNVAGSFGARVAEIVAAVTKPQGIGYFTWIEQLSAMQDESVLRVKLSDLYDNVNPCRPDFPGRDEKIQVKYEPAIAMLERAYAGRRRRAA